MLAGSIIVATHQFVSLVRVLGAPAEVYSSAMNKQRARWFETLFSTSAANHDSAEAAIRAYYQAAELESSGPIIWMDSLAEACYAVLLVCAPHDRLMDQIVEALDKVPGLRRDLARVRERICQALAIADWKEASSIMGRPLEGTGSPIRHNVRGKITLARISLWQDPTAAMGKLAEDDLFLAEGRFWTVVASALQTTGTMLARSISRMYHLAWMAMDQARVGEVAPPPLLSSLWQVAQSAGPWWPFLSGAIITERPLEVHHNAQWLLERGDGPAIRYRDGWKVYAWEGYHYPEKWIMQPESIPVTKLKQTGASFRSYLATRGINFISATKVSLKPSPLFKVDLPFDREERIKFLRNHANGKLPLYDRYQNGERQQVWDELVKLGGAVRTDPHAADALAVAFETMRRVEENTHIIIERLHSLGYQFVTEQSHWQNRGRQIESVLAINPQVSEQGLRSPHVRRVFDMVQSARGILQSQFDAARQTQRDTSIRAHVPPSIDVTKQISKIEKKVGTLPLSLRAFYEVVGSIDLIGQHPSLAPHGGSISPDPLVVYSVQDALADAEQLESDDDDRHVIVAPDDLHKANVSGGEPYEIAVPDERADAELLNERHGLFFVQYLRLAFRFGGFPGYEGYDRDVPGEIAALTQAFRDF